MINYIYLPTVVVVVLVVVVAEAIVSVSTRARITAKISPAPRKAKMDFFCFRNHWANCGEGDGLASVDMICRSLHNASQIKTVIWLIVIVVGYSSRRICVKIDMFVKRIISWYLPWSVPLSLCLAKVLNVWLTKWKGKRSSQLSVGKQGLTTPARYYIQSCSKL